MAFEKKTYGGADLANILKEYPLASTMPDGITKVPGFHDCKTPKEVDEFEAKFFAAEEYKLYKSIHPKTGNVFLIKNPLAASTGERVSYRAPPIAMGHVSEIGGIGHDGGAPKKSKKSWGY